MSFRFPVLSSLAELESEISVQEQKHPFLTFIIVLADIRSIFTFLVVKGVSPLVVKIINKPLEDFYRVVYRRKINDGYILICWRSTVAYRDEWRPL